jgi:hypothetical protein
MPELQDWRGVAEALPYEPWPQYGGAYDEAGSWGADTPVVVIAEVVVGTGCSPDCVEAGGVRRLLTLGCVGW